LVAEILKSIEIRVNISFDSLIQMHIAIVE
jgi:hypothetical protein